MKAIMNKELEALEEIKNHKIKLDADIKYDNGDETQYRFETIKDMFPKQFAIIETALKDHEKITSGDFHIEPINVHIENQKKIKALEIIKEKEANVFIFLHSEDLETYNDMVEDNLKLTQVEFDLLKEVLL